MAADKLHPQHPIEYLKLLEWCSEADSILEIGCRFGKNLVGMAHAMRGKRIVGVDLPDKEGWNFPDIATHLWVNIQGLRAEGFDAHLIIGDSHHPDTLAMVAELAPFDIVFIDGDHSYAGVKADWEYYGPLGKVVIFHDIRRPGNGENQGLEVWKLWEELKDRTDAMEFVAPDSKMGLGRIGTSA